MVSSASHSWQSHLVTSRSIGGLHVNLPSSSVLGHYFTGQSSLSLPVGIWKGAMSIVSHSSVPRPFLTLYHIAFLLNNGHSYYTAHAIALSEYLITLYLLPGTKSLAYVSQLGESSLSEPKHWEWISRCRGHAFWADATLACHDSRVHQLFSCRSIQKT